MYDFIEGKLDSLSPTHAVLENSGMGYFINISLHTYEKIRGKEKVRLFTHLAFKVENQSPVSTVLYGFAEADERYMFQLLTSVSGVGNNTAMIMLSSLQPNDIASAILNGNVSLIKSIKGIGEKTAMRLILELKDKMGKPGKSVAQHIAQSSNVYDEAAQALATLGFNRAMVDKALMKISTSDVGKTNNIEEIIKNALKIL